jgi:hypothetical protein
MVLPAQVWLTEGPHSPSVVTSIVPLDEDVPVDPGEAAEAAAVAA